MAAVLLVFAAFAVQPDAEATPLGDIGQLDKILQIIQAGGVNATGSFHFLNYDIQVQFVITFLSIKSIDIQHATVQDIYDAILIYIRLYVTVDRGNGDVPECDVITVQFILQFLEVQEANRKGNFYFYGYLIQTQFIIEIVKIQNSSVEALTISELYYILVVYIGHEIDTSGNEPRPCEVEIESLEIVREELKVQGCNASGAIVIEDHLILFEYIVSVLHIRNTSVNSVTTEELWVIIQLAIEFQNQSNCSETLDQKILSFFLNVTSDTEVIDSSVLVVNGTRITIKCIITELDLKIDSSGKYDTSGVTAEILIQAIFEIETRSKESTTTTEISV